MKKVVLLLLALVLAFSLVACGEETGDNAPSSTASEDGTETAKKAVVPNLVGKTREQAEAECEGKFTIVAGDGLLSNDHPAGTIMVQDLEAGKEMDITNRPTITVRFCMGKAVMPNLVTGEAEKIKKQLEEMDYIVVIQEANSDEVEAGCIISTTPAEGANIPTGTTITLVVSNGPTGAAQ